MNYTPPKDFWVVPTPDGGYKMMSQDAYDAWLTSIGEKAPKPVEVIEVKPGQCECGSTAAGSSRHSQWCPAFEK